MILGIGNDLIDIRRIQKTLERYGDRFVQRIFTSEEQARSERRRLHAASCQAVCRQRRAPKRLEQGCARAFSGAIWRQQFAVWQADHAPYQWRAPSAEKSRPTACARKSTSR